jgi:hypothetical protein
MTSIAYIGVPQDAAPLGPVGPLLKELVGLLLIRGTMQLDMQRQGLVFQRLPGPLVSLAHAVHDTMAVEPGQGSRRSPCQRAGS